MTIWSLLLVLLAIAAVVGLAKWSGWFDASMMRIVTIVAICIALGVTAYACGITNPLTNTRVPQV